MDKKKIADLTAALLTAGYVVNTKRDIEDIKEAVRLFKSFKKDIAEGGDGSEVIADMDLVSAVLTAGYIVNTDSTIESTEETLQVFHKMRMTVEEIARRTPDTFKGDDELNILSGIIVSGLIVNTRKWEECILEIGVGGYGDHEAGGNSLRMWKAYFPHSQIFGLDLYDKRQHEESRIRIFQGDQGSAAVLRRVAASIGPLDIIIDDGSHLNHQLIRKFSALFPRMR